MKKNILHPNIILHRLLALGVLLFTSFTTLASLQALPPVASWLAEKVEITADGFLLPDAEGGYDLILKGSGGFKLGDKPKQPGDGKSLVFDGTQTQGALTSKKLPNLTKMEVSLQLFLAENPPTDNDQTILRCQQWELRYSPKTSQLAYIVYLGDSYSQVTVKVGTGEWLKVVASAADGTSHLTVNDVTADSTEPANLADSLALGVMVLGGTRAPDSLTRPFSGAIADIRILGEQ